MYNLFFTIKAILLRVGNVIPVKLFKNTAYIENKDMKILFVS